jgi:DNA primase
MGTLAKFPLRTGTMARKLPETTIREIAEKVSILDVISPCVSLTRAGKYYKGLCPFHPDKNPSMVVNPERNTFHCFACGTGGDAYSFFMKFHHVPFMDAVRELARQAGVSLGDRSEQTDPRREEAHRRAVDLNREAARYYAQCLEKSAGAEHARRYLEQRGIGPEMIRDFSMGYAPNGWDGLVRFLSKSPSSLERATSLGLIQPRKSGRGHYDRFRNRIMFPIHGTSGQILAFGGRTLDPEGPKYINSPESFLYKKGSVLYGLHQAHSSIRQMDCVILVEGYMDLITMHRNGFRHAVAVLGTALTLQQIQILKRYSRHFLFLFDGDDAGKQASFRNLPETLEKQVDARAVYLPPEDDPDSFLRRNGRNALQEMLEVAAPLLDCFLREQTEALSYRSTVEEQVRVVREILPVLQKIPDRLEQQLRIRSLSERMGIEERLLVDELSALSKKKERAPSPKVEIRTEPPARWPSEERLVCQILIQFPELSLHFSEAGVLDFFTDRSLKRFVEVLSEHYQTRGTVNLPEIIPLQEDPVLSGLLTGLSCREEFTEPEALTALQDSIRRIRRKSLQARLKRLNQKIREAETQSQKDLQSRLFVEKQRLLEEEKALQP